MQFLVDSIVWILSGYLAFTTMLANGIENALPSLSAPEPSQIEEMVEEKSLSSLPSDYTAAIPDILVQNAAYQQASVIAGVDTRPQPVTEVKDALVNIYCTYKTDEYRRITTGTGFFIDPKGVILTNAHVAQFLLLEAATNTGETECILRSGDPATPLYEVQLLYISPAWVQKHAHLITDNQPKGTGERDFALLYVTAGLDQKPMPQYFPYLATNLDPLTPAAIGENVTAAGYPANEVAISSKAEILRPQTDTTTITDLYTFTSHKADVIEIGESAVGAHGVSGGPIVNKNGAVIGMISTKGNTEARSTTLRGISLSYIDRTIQEESTFDLARTISGHLELRGQLFTQTIATFLSKVLESELE